MAFVPQLTRAPQLTNPPLSQRIRNDKVTRAFRDRAVSGVAASGSGLILTIAIQILGVAWFIATLGTQGYGNWLVLTAIPSYLSMADLGFGSASATDATIKLATGDSDGAAQVLQAAWSMMIYILTGVLTAILAATWIWSGSRETTPSDIISVGCTILATLVWLSVSFIEGAFRAAGEFVRSQVLLNVIRVCEFLTLGLVAATSHRIVHMAMALAAVRTLGVLFYYGSARQRIPWFRLTFRRDAWSQARHILAPSISYLSFPAGYAISNQGIILLVAGSMGSSAVATVAAVRTMANSVRQVANVTNIGTMPELSIAFARHNLVRAKRILFWAFALSGTVSLLLLVLATALGSWWITVWTSGHIHVSTAFITSMVAIVVVEAPWQLAMNVLQAENRHAGLGLIYLTTALAGLGLCWLLLPSVGLLAVPAALAAMTVILVPLAVWKAYQSISWGETPEPGRKSGRGWRSRLSRDGESELAKGI